MPMSPKGLTCRDSVKMIIVVFQVKPMLAIWRAEEDLKDRDVSGS